MFIGFAGQPYTGVKNTNITVIGTTNRGNEHKKSPMDPDNKTKLQTQDRYGPNGHTKVGATFNFSETLTTATSNVAGDLDSSSSGATDAIIVVVVLLLLAAVAFACYWNKETIRKKLSHLHVGEPTRRARPTRHHRGGSVPAKKSNPIFDVVSALLEPTPTHPCPLDICSMAKYCCPDECYLARKSAIGPSFVGMLCLAPVLLTCAVRLS